MKPARPRIWRVIRFGLRVDAFGGAVAVGKRECGKHGGGAAVQAAGQRFKMGQVGCVDLDDLAGEHVVVSLFGASGV